MNEIEKMWIISIINGYTVELMKEGCPPEVIQYTQELKDKLIKILDKMSTL